MRITNHLYGKDATKTLPERRLSLFNLSLIYRDDGIDCGYPHAVCSIYYHAGSERSAVSQVYDLSLPFCHRTVGRYSGFS